MKDSPAPPSVTGMSLSGQRLCLIASLVETFDSPARRRAVIRKLREAGVISDNATILLIEKFNLETV